jgi:hypothetical protein
MEKGMGADLSEKSEWNRKTGKGDFTGDNGFVGLDAIGPASPMHVRPEVGREWGGEELRLLPTEPDKACWKI